MIAEFAARNDLMDIPEPCTTDEVLAVRTVDGLRVVVDLWGPMTPEARRSWADVEFTRNWEEVGWLDDVPAW